MTATLLVSGTLALVLIVLPERYVLRPGFRESGMSFPDPVTPFAPFPALTVTARHMPTPPPRPAIVLPGPAETFWATVVPLLETGRFPDAIPVFDRYLSAHPDDADARRERAVALLAAGRPEEAVNEIGRLLELEDGFDARLFLARTLRDLGRTDEAAAEYARLRNARPDDLDLALEHAQAYAWARRYAEAAGVLEPLLGRGPEAPRARVELARIYYSAGRLTEARALLASLDEGALMEADGLTLQRDIEAALYVPPPVPTPPLSPLERAVAAREAEDFARARALLEEALRGSPSDPALWQAYADLLEYELGDLEGARSALLEIERLETDAGAAPDFGRLYRIAQLEIWLGENVAAEARLVALRAALEASRAESTVTTADVDAALGDLRRWQGDRVGAGGFYAAALAADPDNPRALAGLDALDDEITRQLVELEAPRLGGSAYSLADTDDFARVDLGGEWVSTRGTWVWGGTLGNRWLSGTALDGSEASRQGLFVDLEAARWWRWGTIRTGIDLGLQRLDSTLEVEDASLGASVAIRGRRGVTELRVEHGPAYPLAVTLQSVLARVVQERALLTHTRPLGERWTATAAIDAAWLHADADSLAGGSTEGSARVQASVDVGRAMSESVSVGVTTRTLAFSEASPVTPTAAGGSRRLFWDPRLVVSGGPYVQLRHAFAEQWRLTGRLNPGVALIDERATNGSSVVPHVSLEAGVRREGARYWAAFDVFYGQAQFDGYRTYGARLTLSARDFSTLAAP